MCAQILFSHVPNGLPRWREAFPDGKVEKELVCEVCTSSDILWLHNHFPSKVELSRLKHDKINFVVMLDSPSDEMGVRALELGAKGYCNAYASPDVLKAIASVVIQGGVWIGESILLRILGQISLHAPPEISLTENFDCLTERERQVAILVARGESNKELARSLSLSERTIKAHLTSIFEKIGVRDRLQLALRVRSLR